MQAGALVFGTTLATVSSAILPLLLVRLLGKADLAELMALVLVYDTVALIATGGLPQTLLYYLPKEPLPERRAIAVRIGWVLAGLGVVAALATLLIALTGDALPGVLGDGGGLSLWPLVVLAPSLVTELPARLVPNLLVAEQRAREASIIGVVRTILTTVATLVPVATGQSILAVAAWYSVSRVLFGLTLPLALRLCYRGVPRAASPVSVRQVLRFSLPLGMTDVVSLLNSQFDRWLILLSFPAVVFADYQAGAWQVPILSTIAYSVGAAYMPALVGAFAAREPERALEIWRRTITKVSLVVVPLTVGFMVGARELMSLLFTESYVGAAPVFQLYSLLTLGRVAAFGPVIVAAGRPRYVMQAALLSFMANVLLSIPLTWALGALGPALGTALAFIPTVLFYVWSIGRASGVAPRRVFPLRSYARVVALAALAALPAYGLKRYVGGAQGWGLLIAVLGTSLGFAVLGSLTRTIERSDWRYLADWLKLKFAR